jgi:hypothetical protein
MTGRHPEIGERVAQRNTAPGPENAWIVVAKVDDHSTTLEAPVVVLAHDADLDRMWTIRDLSAEGFWEEFVRIP